MLIIGDKEVESGVISVRSRKEGDLGTMDYDALLGKLRKEIDEKAH